MSTKKGNVNRTRAQKYQNKIKFKNNLHDTNHRIKNLNKMEISNLCNRCKNILEWKIAYKKFKPLKNPSTCVHCNNRKVKFAYHNLCCDCASECMVCPKCGKAEELIHSNATFIEELLKSERVKSLINGLTERKRRHFFRLLKKEENKLSTEENLINKLNSLNVNCSNQRVLLNNGSSSNLPNVSKN